MNMKWSSTVGVGVAAVVSLTILTGSCANSLSEEVSTLHGQYRHIFRTGNRNAASHLWISHVLEGVENLSRSSLEETLTGFCAISGSPVRPNDYNRYLLRLPLAGSDSIIPGFMHYCCWPCVCDTEDFLSVDTLTVRTKEGDTKMYFAAMGDPCVNEEALSVPFTQPFGTRTTTLLQDAPEVRCVNGKLAGATFTDHGLVAIGGFFPADSDDGNDLSVVQVSTTRGQPGRIATTSAGIAYQDEREYSEMCYERELNGHNSGMGEIFRKVAAIHPSKPAQHRCLAGGGVAADAVCPQEGSVSVTK